jgi:hypothetical protein
MQKVIKGNGAVIVYIIKIKYIRTVALEAQGVRSSSAFWQLEVLIWAS